MAKKSNRVRSSRGQAGADRSSPSLSTEEQFRQEYAYVINDLRRIFLLAAVMFTLLIALNMLLS